MDAPPPRETASQARPVEQVVGGGCFSLQGYGRHVNPRLDRVGRPLPPRAPWFHCKAAPEWGPAAHLRGAPACAGAPGWHETETSWLEGPHFQRPRTLVALADLKLYVLALAQGLEPWPSITEWWTKTSPSAVSTKPNPLASLNHLTLPLTMCRSPFRKHRGNGDRRTHALHPEVLRPSVIEAPRWVPIHSIPGLSRPGNACLGGVTSKSKYARNPTMSFRVRALRSLGGAESGSEACRAKPKEADRREATLTPGPPLPAIPVTPLAAGVAVLNPPPPAPSTPAARPDRWRSPAPPAASCHRGGWRGGRIR